MLFAGLNFDRKVQDWIFKNTNPQDDARAREWNILHNRRYDASRDHYSTVRNSKIVVQDWRKKISFRNVQRIQESCAETMKIGHYKRVNNIKELLNLNITLY